MTERFKDLAKAVAASREAPNIPMLILPSDMENLTPDDYARIARQAWADVLSLLNNHPSGGA